MKQNRMKWIGVILSALLALSALNACKDSAV